MAGGDSRERFQPESKLEAGVGGERWLATDTTSGKSVVLSVLDARAASAEQRKEFERFAKLGRTTAHPSLERVLASGETALGNPYLATERVETETLAQRMLREPAMSLHELVRVVTGVIDGLVLAHKTGLIHGDISPERVHLLAGGRAKLVGFGLNRASARAEARRREAETLSAADSFMSPEQAAGGSLSVSADLWSVAAILYRGFTGVAPRALADGRSTVASIASGSTQPTASLRDDIPSSFATLLERALADDPSARFPEMGDLRKGLTASLIAAPIVARMPVYAAPEREGSERPSLDMAAPALPPPPNRPQLGIGPLGARTNQRKESRAGASNWLASQPPAHAALPPPLPNDLGSSRAGGQAIGRVALIKANPHARVTELGVRRSEAKPSPGANERVDFVSDAPPPLRSMDAPAAANQSGLADDDDGVVTSFGSAGLFWPEKVEHRPLPDLRDKGARRGASAPIDDVELRDSEVEIEDLDSTELLDDEVEPLGDSTDAEVEAAITPVAMGAALPAPSAPLSTKAANAALASIASASPRPSSPIFAAIAAKPAIPPPPPTGDQPEPLRRVVIHRDGSLRDFDPKATFASLPPRAWASIALFAIGVFAAIAGITRYSARGVASEESPAVSQGPARREATPPVLEERPAMPDAGSAIEPETPEPVIAEPTAAEPVIPESTIPETSLPEPAGPIVEERPARPATQVRTTTRSSDTTSTAPTMSTAPAPTMNTASTGSTSPTESPRPPTMAPTHSLERDPGF